MKFIHVIRTESGEQLTKFTSRKRANKFMKKHKLLNLSIDYVDVSDLRYYILKIFGI